MTAVLIVLSVFFGISLVVATVAVSILVADGKLTLPGTNARRLMHAKTEHELAKVEWERVVMQTNVDAANEARLSRALGEGASDEVRG